MVKMKDLSTGTLDPLRKMDLKEGASLLAEYKGKSYPVLFEWFAGKHVGCVVIEDQIPSFLL